MMGSVMMVMDALRTAPHVRAQSADADLVLLRRFTEKGDQAAFSEIVQRYAGMVYSVCRRILQDRARAEEIAQETFFRLMTRPQAVTQSLGGWLHRAATRLAVDDRRSEAARRRREAHVAREALLGDTPPQSPHVRWTDISPHIDEALSALPEDSRQLLVRHFLEGCQQQELARESSVSAATISRRIKQAADELRRELRRRGIDVMPSALICLWMRHVNEAVPATLMRELGKMAMFNSARLIARRSLTGLGNRIAASWQALVDARWAAVALLLAAAVVVAVQLRMHAGLFGGHSAAPIRSVEPASEEPRDAADAAQFNSSPAAFAPSSTRTARS